MSSMPSRRRPSASRPKTVRAKSVPAKPSPTHPNQAPLFQAGQRELVTKRRGELAELAFTLKAASLGFGVSKPFGDSERYDAIVDARQLTPTGKNRRQPACPTATRAAHKKRRVHVDTTAPHVPRTEASGRSAEVSREVSRDVSNKRPASSNKKSRRPAAGPTIPCPALRVLQTAAPNRSCPLHPAPPLWRIQIKCSTQLNNGLYRLNAHRRTGGRAVPYLPGEIDFLAAYIIPEDTWYIVPLAAFLGSTSLLFRRRADPKPGLYDQYNEAWRLLRPK